MPSLTHRLPDSRTLHQIDQLHETWSVVMKGLTTKTTLTLDNTLKAHELRSVRPHELIANLLQQLPYSHHSSIQKTVEYLKSRDLSGDEYYAFKLLDTAWEKYHTTLYQRAQDTVLHAREQHAPGYIDTFFRNITFDTALREPLWIQWCSGVARAEEYTILKDLHQYWKAGGRTSRRLQYDAHAVLTDIQYFPDEKKHASDAKGMLDWCRFRWDNLVDWIESNRILKVRTSNMTRALDCINNTVKRELTEAVEMMNRDPLELNAGASQKYEQLCMTCLSQTLREWITTTEDLSVTDLEYTEYVDTVVLMIENTRKDTANIREDIETLKKKFQNTLDYKTRIIQNDAQKHMYVRLVAELRDVCGKSLQDAFHPTIKQVLLNTQQLIGQFERDSDTMDNILSMYQRTNAQFEAAVTSADYLPQLKSEREKMEQACAFSDVADYVEDVVNICTTIIRDPKKSKSTKQQEVLSKLQLEFGKLQTMDVRSDNQLHVIPRVLPDAFRNAERYKANKLQEEIKDVKNKSTTRLLTFQSLIEKAYIPMLDVMASGVQHVLTAITQQNNDLLPVLHRWPASSSTVGDMYMNDELLLQLQKRCSEAQRFAISVLEVSQESENMTEERQKRFRIALQTSKDFILAATCTYKNAWHAVQQLSTTLAELYIHWFGISAAAEPQ